MPTIGGYRTKVIVQAHRNRKVKRIVIDVSPFISTCPVAIVLVTIELWADTRLWKRTRVAENKLWGRFPIVVLGVNTPFSRPVQSEPKQEGCRTILAKQRTQVRGQVLLALLEIGDFPDDLTATHRSVLQKDQPTAIFREQVILKFDHDRCRTGLSQRGLKLDPRFCDRGVRLKGMNKAIGRTSARLD